MQEPSPKAATIDRAQLRQDLERAGTGLLAMVKLPATMAPFAPTLKRLAGDSLSSTCDAIADLPDEVLAPVLWWLDRELFAIQGKGRWLEDPVAFKPDQVSAAFVELRRVILET